MGEPAFDIVAVTGCPTGIAHTFMAAAALEKAAQDRGLTIKVETHGQVGVEGRLTPDEIARARGAIVASDRDVNAGRFSGRPTVIVPVTDAIMDPNALIDRAFSIAEDYIANLDSKGDAAAKAAAHAAAAAGGRAEHDDDTGPLHAFYRHIMGGINHTLPFLVVGGILTAAAQLMGTPAGFVPDALYAIGRLMVLLAMPVLSAHIAESIAGRPAIVSGYAVGLIAEAGLAENASTWGVITGLAFSGGPGFIGAVVGGFLAGYITKALMRGLIRLPKLIDGLKVGVLYPLVPTVVAGLVMCVIAAPTAGMSRVFTEILGSCVLAAPVIAGVLLGCLCAWDFGGPVNKVAFVTGVLTLMTGLLEGGGSLAYAAGTAITAAVSAACMTPPIVTSIACALVPSAFSTDERRESRKNLVLGITHVTEGTIPFVKDGPAAARPIMMASSSLAAVLSFVWGVRSPSPVGGLLICPVVTGWQWWLLAVLLGSIAGGVLFALAKRYDGHRASESVS